MSYLSAGRTGSQHTAFDIASEVFPSGRYKLPLIRLKFPGLLVKELNFSKKSKFKDKGKTPVREIATLESHFI